MTRTHFNPHEVLPNGAKSRAQRRWLFEPKLDGERCLVFGRRGTLRLLSRNQIRLNEK